MRVTIKYFDRSSITVENVRTISHYEFVNKNDIISLELINGNEHDEYVIEVADLEVEF